MYLALDMIVVCTVCSVCVCVSSSGYDSRVCTVCVVCVDSLENNV